MREQHPGDLFESLLTEMRASGDGGKKRIAPRVGVTMSVDLCCWKDGKPVKIGTVRLRDVSRTGVGLMSSMRIRSGTEFCFSLSRLDQTPLRVGFKSVYCNPISERLFTIGAKLIWTGSPSAETAGADAGGGAGEELQRIRKAVLR